MALTFSIAIKWLRSRVNLKQEWRQYFRRWSICPKAIEEMLENRWRRPRTDVGVYTITCHGSGKVYVGHSELMTRRWDQHWRDLRYRRHINLALQTDYDRFGPLSVAFCQVESINGSRAMLPFAEFLMERELHWMIRLASFDPRFGYNTRAEYLELMRRTQT